MSDVRDVGTIHYPAAPRVEGDVVVVDKQTFSDLLSLLSDLVVAKPANLSCQDALTRMNMRLLLALRTTLYEGETQ
jgi:hypothetical protein